MSDSGTGIVRCVTGDMPSGDLGVTLMHEHLISSLRCYWEPDLAPDLAAAKVHLGNLSRIRNSPFACRDNLFLDDISLSVQEMREFRGAGGCTVVDVTSNGLGRDPEAVHLVSAQSGVNIVLGCGYYVAPSHPSGFDERSEDELMREMVDELTRGIANSGVRAGIIGEIGVGSYPMHPHERRVLRAAARAQVATGAGMVVHPAPGDRSAFEIARVLARAGAIMNKVVMSHLDERFRTSLSLFRRLAQFGCVFGFDTFGREVYYPSRRRQHPSDQDRISAILQLLAAGLTDRIVISQDICMRHELSAWGGQGYSHVMRVIVPRLVDAGVGENSIRRMLVDTPSAILTLSH